MALGENLGLQIVFEENLIAQLQALAGAYQSAPDAFSFIQSAQQEKFYASAGFRVSAAVEAGGKHFRVVQDQAITRPDVAMEAGELIVVIAVLISRDDEHSRRVPLLAWLLGDQLFRKLIIKVRDLQTDILGIESSCDETAAAVVRGHNQIVSSVVASQLDTHAKYGGVVPELASREHLRAIVPVVRQALLEANLTLSDLSAVAVTSGPGLVGSLLVGITYAKALCYASKLPLIAVNHVEGHIHSVLLKYPEIRFPALALVVSGGHTHLFEVRAEGEYRLLGKTRDDAAGEAYDKVAKLLGFGYPGGPVIDRLAPYGNPNAVKFPLVKMKGNALDFSFSGLKTAVLRWTERNDIAEEISRRRQLRNTSLEDWLAATSRLTLDMLASFQKTVVEELLRRVNVAAEEIGAEAVIVAGGVACNAGLRARALEQKGTPFYFPDLALSTDNAAMIAAAAFPKFERREFASFDLKAQAGLMLA